MQLTLTIENFTNLPDGGPLRYTVTGARGLDIGRAQYLDWTLPDPERHISSKHCEIRHEYGDYLLYDVSTNGVFVNGSENRTQSPYRLSDGDRLVIGQYIIAVRVEKNANRDSDAVSPDFMHQAAVYDDLWRPEGATPPPISPKDTRPMEAAAIVHGDWLDRPADLPTPSSAPRNDIEQWIAPPPALDLPPETPPAPTPRRPSMPETEEFWLDSPPIKADVASAASMEATPSPHEATATPTAAPVAELQIAEPAFAAFLSAFAAASGAPTGPLSQQGPEELGRQLGGLVRSLASEMKLLLDARSETKRVTRSAQQTTIQLESNNPLKFSPSVDDAMRLMFGPSTRSYLGAEEAFAQGFFDLKQHQVRTFAAMQQAMRIIAEEFDPAGIDKAAEKGGGLFKTARKARLWELYETRWKAMTARHDGGLVGVFMRHFSDCYDKS
ncbi:type VI secretion system-associated FHA domain protein TagH [Methylocystis heyeri]|uniref:Type VI secretion system-associated FHA domain protein TagH n=1 Tax=Methylocystis heyeri TaxID=391905 RepID=A0A6B8KJZ3_9HYPH|nr:type VI secretion system-associated FHA domain protein TagH [Methylocystis heyeri]QGM47265.1 type VI secretion system-associated FHA domain protein TagH [Methylocystis heyeri]